MFLVSKPLQPSIEQLMNLSFTPLLSKQLSTGQVILECMQHMDLCLHNSLSITTDMAWCLSSYNWEILIHLSGCLGLKLDILVQRLDMAAKIMVGARLTMSEFLERICQWSLLKLIEKVIFLLSVTQEICSHQWQPLDYKSSKSLEECSTELWQ